MAAEVSVSGGDEGEKLSESLPSLQPEETETGGSSASLTAPEQVFPEEAKTDDAAKGSWDARTDFTADSPYFTAFCDTEIQQLTTLTDTLTDISQKTRIVCQAGRQLAAATRHLAHSCLLRPEHDVPVEEEKQQDRELLHQQRKEAVGEEMASLLELLGNVLEETAETQLNMCNSMEATLGMSLEAFSNSELKTVSVVKSEADESTTAAEQLYSSYMNGKQQQDSSQAGGGRGSSGKGGFGSSLKNWSRKRGSNQAGGDDPANGSDDPNLAKATTAANLRLTLEQICLTQATAELNRFQLLKLLVSFKHRRNYELGENIMATMHAMRACHSHASDVLSGTVPKLTSIQDKQAELREHHSNSIVPTWQDREVRLVGTLDLVSQKALQANQVVEAVTKGDPQTIDQQLQMLKTEDIEEKVQVWNLPSVLADSARYQREANPGVLIEGWLYRKNSAMISLQAWTRRWFMMDVNSIYYFRNDSDSKRASNGFMADRVKVCDVVLCTVRELSGDAAGGVRFCFELVTPTEKPLMLQARGPQEYKMWVDGIRDNTQKQLVHGDPHSVDLNKNIGKMNKSGSLVRLSSSASNVSDPPTDLSADGASGGMDSSSRETKVRNPLAQEIMAANPTCADCGMADPDWASLNLGVLICMECSGVHRSLGVHVSKVRSLKLDSLTDGESRLLLALGNDKINPIWEKGIGSQTGWKKPTEDADRQTRENWIKSKYMWKGFLDYRGSSETSEVEAEAKYNRDLYEAAKAGDIDEAAFALAHGASPEWTNSDEDGKTALHICALCSPPSDGSKWTAIECAELLIQNGAKLRARDASSHGVLDSALLGNADHQMIEYLTARDG